MAQVRKPADKIVDLDCLKIDSSYDYNSGPGNFIITLFDTCRIKKLKLKEDIDLMQHENHTCFKAWPEGKGGIEYISYGLSGTLSKIEDEYYNDDESFDEIKKMLGKAIMRIAFVHRATLKELWTDMPEFISKTTMMEPEMLPTLYKPEFTAIKVLDLSCLNLQTGQIIKFEPLLKRPQLTYLSLRYNKIPSYEICKVSEWLHQGGTMRQFCFDCMERTRSAGNSSEANIEKEFQITLDYLAGIEPLEFCGISYSGGILSGKAPEYFAEFLKKAHNLKVVFFTQNGYGQGRWSSDQ